MALSEEFEVPLGRVGRVGWWAGRGIGLVVELAELLGDAVAEGASAAMEEQSEGGEDEDEDEGGAETDGDGEDGRGGG